MGWNTATDANGTTYYWNDQGVSQYEKPTDFDANTAQDAGSYTQYASYSNGSYYDWSHLSMQYSRPSHRSCFPKPCSVPPRRSETPRNAKPTPQSCANAGVCCQPNRSSA